MFGTTEISFLSWNLGNFGNLEIYILSLLIVDVGQVAFTWRLRKAAATSQTLD